MKKGFLLAVPFLLFAQSVEFKSYGDCPIEYSDYKINPKDAPIEIKKDVEYYALGETIGVWNSEMVNMDNVKKDSER